MQFFFADDARQNNPSRPGMPGPIIAIGGVSVPAEAVRGLENDLNELCNDYGFPSRDEFKWSPGRDLWMRDKLVEERRKEFFLDALGLVAHSNGTAIVMIEDASYATATDATSAELDVTRLFLERVQLMLNQIDTDGIIITDRPGGGRGPENEFLLECLDTLQQGTEYIIPDRVALNVLSTRSDLVRLLQVADVVTSCTVAFISGEDTYAPPIFDFIKQLLHSTGSRIGGVGLKIHPDFRYVNLYHWLLGDEYHRGYYDDPFPLYDRPYCEGPNFP